MRVAAASTKALPSNQLLLLLTAAASAAVLLSPVESCCSDAAAANTAAGVPRGPNGPFLLAAAPSVEGIPAAAAAARRSALGLQVSPT